VDVDIASNISEAFCGERIPSHAAYGEPCKTMYNSQIRLAGIHRVLSFRQVMGYNVGCCQVLHKAAGV